MAARVAHGTLTASTVASVNLTHDWKKVEVYNRGTTAIYARGDGTNPTVGGDDCDYVGPGEIVVVPTPLTSHTADPVEVKLISSGTPAYTVTGVS